MTRINTNISSLIAQTNLARSNDQLQQSLTRLSTGLRINTGKDDPAGLIASQALGSDISAVQKGISNSQRANQIISTADSALGQVSSLLNDLRGLVVEAANTGALSDAQIQANQLQVDSSLQAIDRIAQTTSFQGRRLLDGSLDFITNGAVDTFATKTVSGATDVKATLNTDNVIYTALSAGAAGNSITINVTAAASTTATIVGNAITVGINTGVTTRGDVASAVNANTAIAALLSATASGAATVAVVTASTALAGGVDGKQFVVTSVSGGATFNGAIISITAGSTGATPTTSYSTATNTLTITATSTSTANQIIQAISAEGHFSAVLLSSNGLGTGVTAGTTTLAGATTGTFSHISALHVNQANFGTSSSITVNLNIDTQATQASLTYSSGALTSALILELGGDKGFNTFNFGSGTTLASLASGINQLSDATGVSAAVNGANLVLTSTDYGSKAFVSTRVLSGSFTTGDGSNVAKTRAEGTNAAVRINGLQATASGLDVSLNSATLNLQFTIDSSLANATALSFTIDGGGANFQLGPDVVSSQQSRLGVRSVSTSELGGTNGRLYELISGGAKALATNARGASAVVNEVITQITTLRGRLGAFQKTTLETNISTLSDTLSSLTDAQSSIKDADFAAESANLTRAQILVQAGTQVLQISNTRPQAILALLRG